MRTVVQVIMATHAGMTTAESESVKMHGATLPMKPEARAAARWQET
jgi:hypothetical protein